jgi:hypothetical protein
MTNRSTTGSRTGVPARRVTSIRVPNPLAGACSTMICVFLAACGSGSTRPMTALTSIQGSCSDIVVGTTDITYTSAGTVSEIRSRSIAFDGSTLDTRVEIRSGSHNEVAGLTFYSREFPEPEYRSLRATYHYLDEKLVNIDLIDNDGVQTSRDILYYEGRLSDVVYNNGDQRTICSLTYDDDALDAIECRNLDEVSGDSLQVEQYRYSNNQLSTMVFGEVTTTFTWQGDRIDSINNDLASYVFHYNSANLVDSVEAYSTLLSQKCTVSYTYGTSNTEGVLPTLTALWNPFINSAFGIDGKLYAPDISALVFVLQAD